MTGRATTRSIPGPAFDIIVVGGGHVGCACALSLAQAGADVALVSGAGPDPAGSAWADEPWDRRVYALSPRSRQFLEQMRVWGQIDATRIAPIRDMRIYDGSPDNAQLHFGAYQAGREALAWIVEHRELSRVLDAAIRYQQRIERLAVDAEQVTVRDDGVTVATSHGELRAALVIGADGVRSRVRDQIGIVAHSKSYEQTGVVANLKIESSHRGVAHQWFIADGVVALLPLPGDAVSLVWSAPRELASVLLEEGPQRLVERLVEITRPVYGSFQSIGGMSGFPLSLLRSESLIASRGALVGDAAHVVHPLAGQGLNLGLEDAEALAQLVGSRESHRHPGDPVLLRRYERSRAEALWSMSQLTDRLLYVFASTDPTLRRLRATGLNALDRLPFLKQVLARQAMS